MKKLTLVALGLIVSVFGLANDLMSGKVVTVIDGNTVELIADDNETYKIMLSGIDSPELGQDYGDKAKQFLESLLLEKSVTVDVKGKDRYGIRHGVVIIDGETDPRVELLKEGLAWTREMDPDKTLERLRETARENGKGLWKDPNPTPPWVFRRQQTMAHFKSS